MRRRVALRKILAAIAAIVAGLLFASGRSPEAMTTTHPGTTERAGPEPVDQVVQAASGVLGLGADEVAVALERPLAPLPLQIGDVIELVALVADDHRGVSANRLGPARVVAVDDRSLTVAVPATVASTVLEHRAIGTIEAVLTPRRHDAYDEAESSIEGTILGVHGRALS